MLDLNQWPVNHAICCPSCVHLHPISYINRHMPNRHKFPAFVSREWKIKSPGRSSVSLTCRPLSTIYCPCVDATDGRFIPNLHITSVPENCSHNILPHTANPGYTGSQPYLTPQVPPARQCRLQAYCRNSSLMTSRSNFS